MKTTVLTMMSFKALKGLALVRLNREDEADLIIKELRDITINDNEKQVWWDPYSLFPGATTFIFAIY